MFVIINTRTSEFVAIEDISHVAPAEEGSGSEVYLKSEAAFISSPMSVGEIFKSCNPPNPRTTFPYYTAEELNRPY